MARAVALGLPEIGIADHLSGVEHTAWDAAAIPFERLDEYVEEVRAVAARHDDITVLLGVEADYVTEHEAGFAELLSAYPFDYVVGGVHVLGGFDFDDPAKRGDPRWSDPDALFVAYYEAVRRAAEFGRFAFIAHLDYIGLWGHEPGPASTPEIDAALDAMAASGTRDRAQHRPRQRPCRRHVPVARHPAARPRARHPAGDQLGRPRAPSTSGGSGTRPSRWRGRPATARRFGSRTGRWCRCPAPDRIAGARIRRGAPVGHAA